MVVVVMVTGVAGSEYLLAVFSGGGECMMLMVS